MAEVTRYGTRIEDGTFSVELEDGWLEVGDVEEIVTLFGGPEYVIEYTDQQAATAWLNTDEDGTITVDVRETMETMTYNEEFVANLVEAPLDETDPKGHPKRTVRYVEAMRDVFDQQGSRDE